MESPHQCQIVFSFSSSSIHMIVFSYYKNSEQPFVESPHQCQLEGSFSSCSMHMVVFGYLKTMLDLHLHVCVQGQALIMLRARFSMPNL